MPIFRYIFWLSWRKCTLLPNENKPLCPSPYPMLSRETQQNSMDTYCDATSFSGFSPAGLVGENPGSEVDCAGPQGVRLRDSWLYSWFATTWQGGHVGGQYNRNFSRKIYVEIEFSCRPRGEQCFCSWPPTWPPWRNVQASNTNWDRGR